MKKLFTIILALAMITAGTVSGAFAYSLSDWQFCPTTDGQVDVIIGIDEITLFGTSLVNSTAGVGNNGTFEQYGAYTGTSYTNGTSIIDNFGAMSDPYEITFVLREATGNFVINTSKINEITYTSAYLDVYLDTSIDFGTASLDASPIFGGNDGVLIAAFELVKGTGTMDFTTATEPDGSTNLMFQADITRTGLTNGLLANTWFDEFGVDLSTYNPDYLPVLAFTDSNNHVIALNKILPVMTSEFGKTDMNTNADDTNYLNFFVHSDGSFDLGANPIPEPASLMLLGGGFLGLGIVSRRKLLKI